MPGYALSPLARADLNGIWDYSEARWSAGQAERYIRSIQSALNTLAADPARGRVCDEIRPGYRKFQVGGHVIFYIEAGGKIDVIRILHQRMDLTTI